MRSPTVLLASSVFCALVVGCASSNDDPATAAGGGAALSSTSTTTKDGTYAAECGDKYNQLTIEAIVAGGKVTKLTGKATGRGEKIHVGTIAANWEATLASNVATIRQTDASTTVLGGDGHLDPFTQTDLTLGADEETVETVKTCASTAKLTSVTVRAADGNADERGVTLGGVDFGVDACLEGEEKPLDDANGWVFRCPLDEGAITDKGFAAFAKALEGLPAAP